MPRSWPSTEPKATAAVIELDLLKSSGPPVTPQPVGGRRPRWTVWAMLLAMVILGLALVPLAAEDTGENADVETLDDPVIATTSTTLAPISVAVMSDDTFSLIPVNDLDGFVQLTGPVEFDGRYWVAGNRRYPSADVTILSSIDGASWEAEASVSADDGEWLRIDDLGSFEGVLMAVGTLGRADGPAYAPSTAGSVVLWKSADGLRWSPLSIAEDPGQEYSNLQLTTGSEEVLITGYQTGAFDSSVMEQIPPELIPGLERGDFTWWYDYGSIRVVAPPGIELFWMPATRPGASTGPDVLFRSDNLIVWEELPANFSAWRVMATFDDGFVSNTYDGDAMYSTDGRSWERTDRFPSLFYQNWGDRLVGLDFHGPEPTMVLLDGEGASTIEFPTEITENRQYPFWVTPGPSGLASILGTFEQVFAEPITRADGYILAMENGALRIEGPSGETSYANFDYNGLIEGSYIPVTESIRFEITDEGKSFEFPVAVFLDLRERPQRGRFDVFLSDDGLVWARPQTGLRAEYADILGSADQTFLVALHNYGRDYRQQPITVYRTGPIG